MSLDSPEDPLKAAALLVLIACSGAWAQTRSNEFPDGSAAMTQEALRASVEDKVFAVKASTGPVWRWQFKSNGFFFINIGNFSDSGTWSAKDSTICTEGRQIKASCNEVRAKGQELYLERDSGEVVRLDLQ